VIGNLKARGGKWPRSCDDRRPQFSANNGRAGGWNSSRFQDRIGIDFSAAPDDLRWSSAESPLASFWANWAKRNSGVRVGDGPSERLCDYFRQDEKHGPAGGDVAGIKK